MYVHIFNVRRYNISLYNYYIKEFRSNAQFNVLCKQSSSKKF